MVLAFVILTPHGLIRLVPGTLLLWSSLLLCLLSSIVSFNRLLVDHLLTECLLLLSLLLTIINRSTTLLILSFEWLLDLTIGAHVDDFDSLTDVEFGLDHHGVVALF